MTAVAVGVVCVLVYVLGIPLGSLCILYRRHGTLNDPSTLAVFGSLYLAYERPYWYWESVEMVKKMILAGGLVMVATGSALQVLIGVLVAFGYFTLVVRLEPYEDILDDRLQACTSVQLIMNLLLGLFLKLDSRSDHPEFNSETVGAVLVIANILVLLGGLVLVCLAFPQCQSKKACFAAVREWGKKGRDLRAKNVGNKQIGALVKALKDSLKGEQLQRGIGLGVKLSRHPMTFEEAEKEWTVVTQSIENTTQRRHILNLFKVLYTTSMPSVPSVKAKGKKDHSTKRIEMKHMKDNPMHSRNQRHSVRLKEVNQTMKGNETESALKIDIEPGPASSATMDPNTGFSNPLYQKRL